jgi:hypothetical protein
LRRGYAWIPKGYKEGNGYECVQEPWIVACTLLYIYGSGFPSAHGHREGSGIIQPDKPNANGIGTFSLSSTHAVEPTNPNQAPRDCEFIPVGKISSAHSDTAECLKPKSRRKHAEFCCGVNEDTTEKTPNRPNKTEFPENKQKRKAVCNTNPLAGKSSNPSYCNVFCY